MTASIFDSPTRKEDMKRAQAEWDALIESDRRIMAESRRRNNPRGRKPNKGQFQRPIPKD